MPSTASTSLTHSGTVLKQCRSMSGGGFGSVSGLVCLLGFGAAVGLAGYASLYCLMLWLAGVGLVICFGVYMVHLDFVGSLGSVSSCVLLSILVAFGVLGYAGLDDVVVHSVGCWYSSSCIGSGLGCVSTSSLGVLGGAGVDLSQSVFAFGVPTLVVVDFACPTGIPCCALLGSGFFGLSVLIFLCPPVGDSPMY